jgi:hypothetical protein
MKVCDLISKIVDNYVEIVIEEFKGKDRTGRRWNITPHSTDYRNIPEDVWNAEVSMIVPYYTSISIVIESK